MALTFPTRRELQKMPLSKLRLLDVRTPEEEKALQEVVDQKLFEAPDEANVFRGDVPDIKTPEEEKKWQAKIDERAKRLKARKGGKKALDDAKTGTVRKVVAAGPTPDLMKPVADVNEELVDYTIEQGDLDSNPELVSKGVKVGDVIQIPKSVLEEAEESVKKNPEDTKTGDAPKKFCDTCDSRGGFHKANCPTKAAK